MNDQWGEQLSTDGRRGFTSGRRRRRAALLMGGIVLAGALFSGGWMLGHSRSELSALRVLPGEFEQQRALLLSWPSPPRIGHGIHHKVFTDIIAAVSDRLEVVVVTRDEDTAQEVLRLLTSRGLAQDGLRFLYAPSSTLWVRDFGPLFAKSFDGGHEVIDTIYDRTPEFPGQDRVPRVIAQRLGLPVVEARVVMENGNLLSNGAGLCITTSKLLRVNSERGISELDLTRMLQQCFGAELVVYLEPLAGEANGHADMFATFTAPDTIVVGKYETADDPINAAILDHNAARLANLRTPFGPLKVHRIPMPKRHGNLWYTYTNVAYANGVLLVPSYRDIEPELEEEAISVYPNVLPGWEIRRIDCSDLIQFHGSLHCATAGLISGALAGAPPSVGR